MADRLALIIANSEFDDPRLTHLAMPSRDAEALAEVLRDPDVGAFDNVKVLLNDPLWVVRREVARLYQRRRRGDLLLFYYSGHGFRDAHGELYLAVRDTEKDTFSATGLDAAFLRRQLDQSSSQRKVVVLDCCHSGAFGAKSVLDTSVGTEEAFIGSGYGQVILTATDTIQYAWERDRVIGEAEASVFTHFLVQGLQTGNADLDRNGDISHNEIYEYVYEQILRSGVTKQTPLMLAPRVEGRIVIARNPHLVVKPADLPPQMQRAIESPFAGVREGAAEVPVRMPEPVARDKDTMIWPKDGKVMVWVPAGVFLYGDDKQKVKLPEFWIDKTPVTNAEYARFVADMGHEPPQHWKGRMPWTGKTPPRKIADHPVTNVNWHDAVAYAKWAGKRLPIEQEWEKAARGTQGRPYPWGIGEPTPEMCNFGRNVGSTTPVGRYSPQGDSPFGCVDMAGNVWEWTVSDHEVGGKVLRGGSWIIGAYYVRSVDRNWDQPHSTYIDRGFRCAADATP